MNDKKNKDSIIYPENQGPKNSQILAIVLGVVLLFVILGAILYFTKSNKVEQIPVATVPAVSDEVKKETSDKLTDLYKSEGAPTVVEGKDPLNYGLDKKDKSPISGSFIFSGKRQPFLKDVQEFSLDVSSSTAQPQEFLAYHADVMAEFDDPSNPTSMFLLAQPSLTGGAAKVSNYDLATKKLKTYVSAQGSSQRNLEWSKAKHLLAYNRLSEVSKTYVDLLPIGNWEIAIIDTQTDTQVDVVHDAFCPRWSPDGTKLMYLKKDGMYLYDMTSKQETKILSVADGEEVIATSMFDISPDGTHLVWTTAKTGIITMSKITSWDNFAITELGRIHVPEMEYYWPQFSPDSLHYAVQAIDTYKGDSDIRENARIEIRPTEGRDIVYRYNLDDFAFNVLFTDDWIAKKP